MKGLLYSVSNAVGRLWEPKPLLMKWVYTGIVRPMVTYGLAVWANRACNHYESLDRLQHLAILTMTHVRHTMPTMGAEILTQLMLLDLFIQEMAVKTTLCKHTRNPQLWDGIGCGKLRGHLQWGPQVSVQRRERQKS